MNNPDQFDDLIDDNDDELLDLEETSDLASIRDELTTALVETTDIEVLGRPGYAVRCRLEIEGKDLERLRQRSKSKRFADGIDGIKYAALVLATYTTAIIRKGTPLDLGTDAPVTFTTPEFQRLLGTADADSTVRAFFGREGHIDAAARRLMDEAGWGEDAYIVDPTV